MNRIDELLEQLELLDLSEPEAKLYLALLKISPATVKELAHATKIVRTSMYDYLNLLVEKGLVAKLVKGKIALFVAINPEENLRHLIEDKLQRLQTLQRGFSEITPLLRQLKESGDADIRYYKGSIGVKKIYEEALRAKELRSYVNMALMSEKLPKNSAIFAEALKSNKIIKMFEIIENMPRSKEQVEFQANHANHPRYFYKFLPQGKTLSATDTLIYDGNVAIINVRDQITGVVLQNTDYYNNAKELFELIWDGLPEVKRQEN